MTIIAVACIILIIVVSVGSSILLVSLVPDITDITKSIVFEEPDVSIVHKVADGGNFEELWSRPDVFGSQDSPPPVITAAGGTVFVLGNTSSKKQDKIIAIDALNGGDVLWSDNGPGDVGPASIYATSSALYVGSGGTTFLTAYSLRSGEKFWTKFLLGARGVDSIYAAGDVIYVRTSDAYYFLQTDTGEVLEQSIFSWQALPSATNIKPDYFMTGRAFTKNTIIEFDPEFSDLIKVVDFQTGNELWRMGKVVSNVATTETTAYLLTVEGKVLGLNLSNGEVIDSIQFDSPSYGQIAVDRDEKLLYVLLEDSKQLFAFKIVDVPGN